MKPLLVLRPKPGASTTAEKAAALDLAAVVVPLFHIQPLKWEPVDASSYDAVFITSSNTLKYCGKNIKSLHNIPTYCVGSATATAARTAGFVEIISGQSDADALAELAAAAGHRRMIWLAGTPSIPLSHPDLIIDVRTIYESAETRLDAVELRSIRQPGVALLHSPRAAQRFARLVDHRAETDIVAISEKAAIAAGPGWASVQWPDSPSDDAMLALSAPLCRDG